VGAGGFEQATSNYFFVFYTAFPMLFVIPWIFVRASLENTG
jgi:hypothetical protein